MGRSTQAEVLQLFGQPKRLDTPEGQAADEPNPEAWYVYDGGGEFPGDLTVVIDDRRNSVLRIDLQPQSLSKEEVIKHFGDDYLITRYNFDECLGNEESAPLYESPSGVAMYIEYRERGIAIAVDANDEVRYISYVSKPIGAPASKCKEAR